MVRMGLNCWMINNGVHLLSLILLYPEWLIRILWWRSFRELGFRSNWLHSKWLPLVGSLLAPMCHHLLKWIKIIWRNSLQKLDRLSNSFEGMNKSCMLFRIQLFCAGGWEPNRNCVDRFSRNVFPHFKMNREKRTETKRSESRSNKTNSNLTTLIATIQFIHSPRKSPIWALIRDHLSSHHWKQSIRFSKWNGEMLFRFSAVVQRLSNVPYPWNVWLAFRKLFATAIGRVSPGFGN